MTMQREPGVWALRQTFTVWGEEGDFQPISAKDTAATSYRDLGIMPGFLLAYRAVLNPTWPSSE